MSGFNLDDYVDVAERIRLFYEKYPEGRIQTVEHGKYEVGGREFIYCKATAFRSAEDEHGCNGIAWEPFPGPTPYTRDSELMNSETSAWGRAIIAAGIPSKKIASREEVENRRGSQATGARADSRSATQPAGSPNGKKKPEQLAYLSKMLATLKRTQPGTDWEAEAREFSIKWFGKDHSQELTKAELDSLVTEVEKWLAHLEPAVPFG
jgi:hypothetical protein